LDLARRGVDLVEHEPARLHVDGSVRRVRVVAEHDTHVIAARREIGEAADDGCDTLAAVQRRVRSRGNGIGRLRRGYGQGEKRAGGESRAGATSKRGGRHDQTSSLSVPGIVARPTVSVPPLAVRRYESNKYVQREARRGPCARLCPVAGGRRPCRDKLARIS